MTPPYRQYTCPICGAGGADHHDREPLCHRCHFSIVMLPSMNGMIIDQSPMKISRLSPLTHEMNTKYLNITQRQLDRWRNGELIQHAFPQLTVDEREFLKTGHTAEDWNKIFGNKD